MDLMAEINDYLYSPEQVRARQARRAARESVLYSQLALARGAPSAVMEKRAHGWNMPMDGRDVVEGEPIGSQHPGAAALLIVRQAMGEYSIPNKVELRYAGMKRASGHGAFAVDEGVIFVEATLHSISGPRHHIDVPVVVREGRLLSPSILIHDGNKRVMTQSTFDDILGMGEFKANAADRPNMYSPAPDKDASGRQRRQVPVINPGMFHVAPSRRLIQSAVKGFAVSSAISADQTAMRFVSWYEHDIKKGEFRDLREVHDSMHDQAKVEFMRDAIPSGFQPGQSRERIIAEAHAFADEVVAMALPEVEGAFSEREAQLEIEAGPKEWLAGGALALGLGMGAPGLAHAQPGSYDPANQQVYQQGNLPHPGEGKGPLELGKQRDSKAETDLRVIPPKLDALKKKYQGDERLSKYFQRAMDNIMQAEPGAAESVAEGAISYVAKSKGPASPEVRAVKDGIEAARLQTRLNEVQKLNPAKMVRGELLTPEEADEMEREAQLKKLLAPALMGLGLATAPGPAQAQPGSYDPANQNTYQYSNQAEPGAGKQPFQYGKQRDSTQESELKSIGPKLDALKKKYQGDERLSKYFQKAVDTVMQSAPEEVDAAVEGAVSYVAKSKGPASPEVRAVKDGIEAGKLQKRQTELSQLNAPKMVRGGQHVAFYEPDVTGVLENGSLGKDTPGAEQSMLDVGERPMDDMLSPGQSVTLKSNATVRDRGGVAYSVPKGSKGTVVRDVDGANWAYYVRFEELGFAATVPRKALA